MTSNGRAPRPLVSIVSVPLRVVFAAGLTGYLLWKSHPADVLAATARADWKPIGAAIMLVLIDRALMAYRWVALLYAIEPQQRPPIGPLVRIFFVSTFIGTFLPASIGSDALRSYSVSRLRVDPADAIASVVMDRVLGIASILIMAALGLTLSRRLMTSVPVMLALIAAAGVCAVTGLLIFGPPAGAAAGALVTRLPFERLRGAVGRVLSSVRKYAGHRPVLANVLGSSIVVQTLRIIQAYFLGLGLGLDQPLVTYFALIPMILLVMLLPVTFNGIGTSQAAFVWFFGQAGVEAAPAFALSVLFVALGIVGNLPGAALYAWGSNTIIKSPAGTS